MYRVDGPECPECGCQDGDDWPDRRTWMGVRRVRECRHCGKVFTVRKDDPEPGLIDAVVKVFKRRRSRG